MYNLEIKNETKPNNNNCFIRYGNEYTHSYNIFHAYNLDDYYIDLCRGTSTKGLQSNGILVFNVFDRFVVNLTINFKSEVTFIY